MLMNLLIPLAAFAVSLTGATTLSPDLMRRAGLNEDQISAFEEAKELKEAGDFDKARDVLMSAHIDEGVMEQLREAMRERRQDHDIAIKAAVEAKDYESFKAAAAGSPLGEIIDSRAEFDRFVEAHALMETGDKDEAKAIFEDLGLNWGHGHSKGEGKGGRFHPALEGLSEDQRQELRDAMQERDHDKVREILQEAGIDLKMKLRDQTGR